MPNIKDVCCQLDIYTDKLSAQVRTLAVGLLAFAGGLIVSVVTETKGAPKVPLWLLNRLFFIAVGALLALALDLTQYSAMYLYMRSVQKSLERKIKAKLAEEPSFDRYQLQQGYNESDPRFVAGLVCFVLKILVLLYAVIWLVVDAYALLKHPT